MRNMVDQPLLNGSSSTPNKSSRLITWQCSNLDKEMASLAEGYIVNICLVTILNSLGAIAACVLNCLVLYGVRRNNRLGKVMRSLATILALEGLFSAVFVQSFFVVTKLLVLADPFLSERSTYCFLLSIVVHTGKLSGCLSIVTILGISVERYIAVIHPVYYRTSKRLFLNALALTLAVQPVNVILSASCARYVPFSRVFITIETIIVYIFTIYANIKIHIRLSKTLRFRGKLNLAAVTRQKKRMLNSFLVTGIYLVCYLPLLIVRGSNVDEYESVKLYIQPWLSTLLFLSYSANALLYSWHSIKTSSIRVQSQPGLEGGMVEVSLQAA